MEQEGTNNLYTVKEDDLWNEEDVKEINNIDNMLNDSSSSKSSRRPSYEQLEVEAMPRSSGTANYVTPAIKRWYVLCGVCPEGIEFTKGERQLAFVWKIIGFIASVILTPAAIYSALEGYRMDEPIKIILTVAVFIGGVTFRNKVDLIISKSIDAKECIRDPDDCKKLHAIAKPFSAAVPILFFKFWTTGIPIIMYYPIYTLIFVQGKYLMAGFCVAYLLLGLPIFAMQQYNVFSRTFLARKNEIEIKSYLSIVEDIVLNKKKVINKKDSLRLLREHQMNFEYRMKERKKAYFFHPLNVFLGIVVSISVILVFVTRTMTNDIPFEIGTHLCVLYVLFMGMFLLTYVHGFQLAAGPIIFRKACEKLKFIDFIKGVEEKLTMRYETFDEYWLKEQRRMVTVHVLGFSLDGELLKKIIFSLASLSSIAVIYVGRSLIFTSNY